ncbi:DUF3551 domain-containing protein [Bradyrhizobium sp. LHD-71]|uniref:DUF3551 domain-containing protein n=1 Tax=Bradyrhizobium sp. LHD-71 TaxID=3072141 RepID=UPI00280F5AB1|nr:DUF3551 domain-containing protein [Bradyrhizobium sp. LHD-71]MDQ8729926.1 DUF3551 domain-containing protein [Bradyrhizobium sp. LHD-71]
MKDFIQSLPVVAVAATMLTATPGRAEVEYPWCAITSIGQSGMPACLYSTLEQCRAFIGGQAGFCQPNARLVAAPRTVKRGAR